MRSHPSYRPIEYRQLCAVVKMILQQAPTIDDAEWKAQIQDRLEALGFEPPKGDMLSRAMAQMEHVLRQTIGPRLQRPIPAPAKPEAPSVPPPESVRTNRPAGWDIVVSMMRNLRKVSPVCASTLPQRSPRREVLGITEADALNEFWKQIGQGADKLALLRAFAEVAIIRPDGWSPEAVRAEFQALTFGDDNCFVCFYHETHIHHIIQIQHGGSNHRRNYAALCERCHGTVHPWLGVHPTRATRGWTQVGRIKPEQGWKKRERETA